jgi:hypothetical protein
METIATGAAAAILRDIDQAAAERVNLYTISRRIGMGKVEQSKAISAGLLEVQGAGGRGHPYTVTQDEARTLLLAAVLAAAAAVSVAAMLRGVKGAGLTGPAAAAVIRQIAQT